MKNTYFQVGQIVKVNDGTEDPDFGTDIGGWQGKVTEIEETVICVELDSKTLSSFPDDYIKKCEEDGLDWERIYLFSKDIELAEQRDNQLDLYRIRKNKIYFG